jgi:hypothetical protein
MSEAHSHSNHRNPRVNVQGASVIPSGRQQATGEVGLRTDNIAVRDVVSAVRDIQDTDLLQSKVLQNESVKADLQHVRHRRETC